MLSGIGPGSLLLILVIVILLFGTKKLRNMGGDLGSAIKSFRSAVKDGEDKSGKDDSRGEVEGPAQREEGEVIEGESAREERSRE